MFKINLVKEIGEKKITIHSDGLTPRLALKKYGWSNQVKSDLRGEVIYNFIVESSNEEDRQEGLNFLDQHMKDRKDIYGNTYTWLK